MARKRFRFRHQGPIVRGNPPMVSHRKMLEMLSLGVSLFMMTSSCLMIELHELLRMTRNHRFQNTLYCFGWYLKWSVYGCLYEVVDDTCQIVPLWIKHIESELNLYQMETFSALLVICARTSPATGEFPAQRPVTRTFDVLFDLN